MTCALELEKGAPPLSALTLLPLEDSFAEEVALHVLLDVGSRLHS